MKTLTLYQPWAMLVAIGTKQIETRSWSTSYRGQIAIHVSKKMDATSRKLCGWFDNEPFGSTLKGIFWDKKPSTVLGMPAEMWYPIPENYHLGSIIATCDLIDIVLISPTIWNVLRSYYDEGVTSHPISVHPEQEFGDYTPGRYAWILDNVKPLEKPIPAKGSLGLWNWEPPICPS